MYIKELSKQSQQSLIRRYRFPYALCNPHKKPYVWEPTVTEEWSTDSNTYPSPDVYAVQVKLSGLIGSLYEIGKVSIEEMAIGATRNDEIRITLRSNVKTPKKWHEIRQSIGMNFCLDIR